MSGVRLGELTRFLEQLAPPALAEEWDRSGLAVGDPDQRIHRVLVSLDPTVQAVDEAIRQRCDLLLTHHPLLLTPLKSLDLSRPLPKLVAKLLANSIAQVSAHTNFDRAAAGVNDCLAQALGLANVGPLTGGEPALKVVVTAPREAADPLMAAIALAGGGTIGRYRGCAFLSGGTGVFTPGPGTSPYIGSEGVEERVEETRIEATVARSALEAVVAAVRDAHPYEEPVIDLYPMEVASTGGSLGRVGDLEGETTLGEFARFAAAKLGAPGVRFAGDPSAPVRTVAVCGGSGASLWREARRRGADALLTGDVKYHEALDALAEGFCLIDAGHGPTEKVALARFSTAIERWSTERGTGVSTFIHLGADPFTFLVNEAGEAGVEFTIGAPSAPGGTA